MNKLLAIALLVLVGCSNAKQHMAENDLAYNLPIGTTEQICERVANTEAHCNY